ncbi:nicotinate-nucleotide adenylyltransferase [Coraliomargarita sinensis]|uniref:Nicotinate-nucleotide adenylyltransferase n=1 Tax=Coraliomargarita sinensis TaxID=2174842 RepID=A0A317ZJC2_9BACT|nr:TonB-dependent receptor [Coraliomargarita sinensis]PXA03998.1 nicotinate-nucleotide adenylyltransferase [Coraliomargarita sinensis]
MAERKIYSTYEKALAINLDETRYGVFAEIGAGQETANWFFRVSGSKGTVAKTISAYDMTMSDAIYGKAKRYVSESRLSSMLEYEYGILEDRLGAERGKDTTFFSFCNTVRARGYQDTEECYGWLGIRLQLKPQTEPCDIVLHVRLLDETNADQMEALGKLGVNLIHAAFNYRDNLQSFVDSLRDGISNWSIEVDMLRFTGEGFRYVDNRLCALQLVQSGLSDAAMFNEKGEVVQAADALYKRPILLLRGSFNPVLKLHLDMIQQSRKVFSGVISEEQRDRAMEICEISMNNLLRDGGAVDHEDFIDRADALQELGKTVLISRTAEFHRIATYLSRYTEEPIAIILSIGLLNELFKAKWSENLPGGILESFGRLFKNRVQLFVYPWHNTHSMELVTAENFKAPDSWEHFYQHLLENKRVLPIGVGDPSLLAKTSRKILKMIEDNDEDWQNWVPPEAHDMVRRRCGRNA